MKQKPQPEMATILLAFITFISLGMAGGLLGLAWPSMAADFNVRLEDQGVLLMMMGAQWYLLFNVISGAASIPANLVEVARTGVAAIARGPGPM